MAQAIIFSFQLALISTLYHKRVKHGTILKEDSFEYFKQDLGRSRVTNVHIKYPIIILIFNAIDSQRKSLKFLFC